MSKQKRSPEDRTLPEMSHVALSLYKSKDEVREVDGHKHVIPGKWQLVRIKFDIDTGQVGDVSLQEMEDLGYAIERVNVAFEEEVFPHEQ